MAHLRTVEFEQEEVEGAFRFLDESALHGVSAHGYLNYGLWALVCDHRGGAPQVGIVTEAAVQARLTRPIDVEAEGVLQPDEETLVMDAIADAIEDGAVRRPAVDGVVPDDWVLPPDDAAGIRWRNQDTVFGLTVPIPGDELGWGPFSVRVTLDGHEARYSAVFEGDGMASDAPEAGFAVWDDSLLIVAGRCPDMEDEGYLAFAIASDPVVLGASERRHWRAGFATAILMRGARIGTDPREGEYGFRSPVSHLLADGP